MGLSFPVAEYDAMRARYGPGKLSVSAVWSEKDRSLHLTVVATLGPAGAGKSDA